jgi:hypothetical protein
MRFISASVNSENLGRQFAIGPAVAFVFFLLVTSFSDRENPGSQELRDIFSIQPYHSHRVVLNYKHIPPGETKNIAS